MTKAFSVSAPAKQFETAILARRIPDQKGTRMAFSRRRLLQLSLGSAAALWMRGRASRDWFDKSEPDLADDSVTRRSWALGSDVSMTVMGMPCDRAEQALDAAFAELDFVEQVMSLYRPDSQL